MFIQLISWSDYHLHVLLQMPGPETILVKTHVTFPLGLKILSTPAQRLQFSRIKKTSTDLQTL